MPTSVDQPRTDNQSGPGPLSAGVRTARTLRVSVRLHAQLARYAPNPATGKAELTLPGGASVGSLLAHLSLPSTSRIIVGVNGTSADVATPLRDGDRIDLITPMAGGAS